MRAIEFSRVIEEFNSDKIWNRDTQLTDHDIKNLCVTLLAKQGIKHETHNGQVVACPLCGM
jgi:hypothetical protein